MVVYVGLTVWRGDNVRRRHILILAAGDEGGGHGMHFLYLLLPGGEATLTRARIEAYLITFLFSKLSPV